MMSTAQIQLSLACIAVCIAVCIAFFYFTIPAITLAQIPSLANTTTLEVEPRYPKPDSTFTMRFALYGDTVSNISWLVDGVPVTGQGNTITLTAPSSLGESMRVNVRAETRSGPISLSRIITVGDVDIIFEADTFAPYFYEGRRTPGTGTNATVVAVPHLFSERGVAYNANDLRYTWSINNTLAAEGVGMTRFSVPLPRLSESVVGLSVKNSSGIELYATTFTVPRTNPAVVFYPLSPLSGLSRNAVQDSYLNARNEVTLRAEPYAMSRDIFEHAEYMWSINGGEVDNQSGDPQLITLRGNAGGSSDIGFSLRDLTALSQYAAGIFRISFQ